MTILASIIAVLFLMALIISKNPFYPAVILCLSYLFSCILGIPFEKRWCIHLHQETIAIIVGGLAAFVIIFALTTLLLRKNGKKKLQMNYKYISVSNLKIIALILIQLATAVACYLSVSNIAGTININNASSVIGKYREMSAYGSELISVPGYVIQLQKISNIIFYFVCFICFNNLYYCRKNKKRMSKKQLSLFLISCALQIIPSILLGGRYTIICLIVGVISMTSIVSAMGKKTSTNGIKIKGYIKIVLIIILSLFAFSSMRTVVGRTTEGDVYTYVATYFGGSVPLLDKKIATGDGSIGHGGYYTFSNAKSLMSSVGFSDGEYMKGNMDFEVSGTLVGNVYTSFYDYYYDYGYAGVIILMLILGIIWAILSHSVYYGLDNRHTFIKLCIVYCIFINSIYLHSYAEGFYDKILSVTFLLQLVYISVIYRFIFGNRQQMEIKNVVEK